MRGKWFFKKWFKKNTSALSKPKNNINIPRIDEIKDKSRIQEYKDEYKNILDRPVTFVTNDIHSRYLDDRLRMFIDLLTEVANSDDADMFNVFDSVLPLFMQDLKVNSLKLQMYLLEIDDLIDEVKARLIALDEILKKLKRFTNNKLNYIFGKEEIHFAKNKIETVENEINILSNQLINFYHNSYSIIRIIKAFKDKLEYISVKIKVENIDYDESEEKDNFRERWRYKVRIDLKRVLKENLDEFLEYYPTYLEKIAAGEIILEKYVYSHKEEVVECNSSLEDLMKNFNSYTKDTALDKICEIEDKLTLFKRYSRALVSDEMLEKLWRIKFEVLTSDLSSLNKITKRNTSEKEYEVYSKILEEKIKKILLDTDKSIEEEFGIYKNYAMKCIRKIFKGESHKINVEDIFLDKRFALVMYLDKGLGIDGYLRHGEVAYPRNASSVSDYYDEANDLRLKFTKNDNGVECIPLKSLYILSDYAGTGDRYPCRESLYYKLHTLIEKRKELKAEVDYYLPEGIEAIIVREKENSVALNNLRSQFNRKVVHFPSTLKSIKGPLFKGTFIIRLVLNDGLEIIKGHGCEKFLSSINIPASVRYIDHNGLNFKALTNISFSNYKDANLLKREKGRFKRELLDLIKYFWKKSLVEVKFYEDEEDGKGNFVTLKAQEIARIEWRYEEYYNNGHPSLNTLEHIAEDFSKIIKKRELENEENEKRLSLK